MIWEAQMRSDGHFNSPVQIRILRRWAKNPESPRFLPRLCFVSKAIRDETIGVFMRNSVFTIHSIFDNVFLQKLVASVEGGALNIRELTFANLDCFPEYDRETGEWIPVNSDLELAVDCKGPHTVHLTMGRRFLGVRYLDIDGEEYVYQGYSVSRLVEKYRLRRLLDCNQLRVIHWHGLYMIPESCQVLQNLADWIKAEFECHGRKIRCNVS